MDQKAVAFARSWARRYVRTKHPHGVDEEDVENRVLESLYKYGRGKLPAGIDPNDDPALKEALAEALNEIQNDCRKVKLVLTMLPPEDRRAASFCPLRSSCANPRTDSQGLSLAVCGSRWKIML